MPQLLFTLVAMFSGASIGAALFAAWCYIRLLFMDKDIDPKQRKRLRRLILVKVGVSGTYGVLLAIIIPRATVVPAFRSYAYAVFLVITALGFIGLASQASEELAEVESKNQEEDRQVEGGIDV